MCSDVICFVFSPQELFNLRNIIRDFLRQVIYRRRLHIIWLCPKPLEFDTTSQPHIFHYFPLSSESVHLENDLNFCFRQVLENLSSEESLVTFWSLYSVYHPLYLEHFESRFKSYPLKIDGLGVRARTELVLGEKPTLEKVCYSEEWICSVFCRSGELGFLDFNVGSSALFFPEWSPLNFVLSLSSLVYNQLKKQDKRCAVYSPLDTDPLSLTYLLETALLSDADKKLREDRLEYTQDSFDYVGLAVVKELVRPRKILLNTSKD